jgi:L-2,4-diaminobutyrate decarboxylase
VTSRRAWQDLFVATDEVGQRNLLAAAQASIASLALSGLVPRSNWSPSHLHESIWSLEICPEDGESITTVLAEFGTRVWSHGVAPSDPACVAHLHPPTLIPAVAAELSIAATNQSMDSWDQAPAATEVELHLMSWLAGVVGFGDTGSGVMTSGGTASNLLGLTLARSRASERIGVDVLKSGLPPQAANWRIVCSDQAHFSIQRAAALLGFGRDRVVAVATTPSGAMDVEALDRSLDELHCAGLQTIAIVGTAGTTDLGAIDPIAEIAERAGDSGSWFHVDAAVAGSFLLSNRLRPRLAGIELADSVTIDFHKLWWQPFNASALVVRDVDDFDMLRVRSAYLDRGDEMEGMTNLVGRSLDTSRRFDAAKVVASLRTLGRAVFAEMLEHLVDLTAYAASVIETTPALDLVAQPTSVMCVFDAPGAFPDDLRRVQQRMLLRGEMVIGRTEIHGRVALKFTFVNPLTTDQDVDRLINMVTAEFAALSR